MAGLLGVSLGRRDRFLRLDRKFIPSHSSISLSSQPHYASKNNPSPPDTQGERGDLSFSFSLADYMAITLF
jgi:hypothetical protein